MLVDDVARRDLLNLPCSWEVSPRIPGHLGELVVFRVGDAFVALDGLLDLNKSDMFVEEFDKQHPAFRVHGFIGVSGEHN